MSVELVDKMGSCLAVVNAARVSFDKFSFELDDKDRRLLRYLAKHGHWSPFAHAFLQFRIKAPIFVARQLVKHQVGLSWNEVSRRYVDVDLEFYKPDTWRGRAANNKQGSEGKVEDQKSAKDILDDTHTVCYTNYVMLLEQGVAPEMARMVLPQTMITEWVWSGSLHAFSRICKQRMDPHSQQETQVIASAINDNCKQAFPDSWDALMQAA